MLIVAVLIPRLLWLDQCAKGVGPASTGILIGDGGDHRSRAAEPGPGAVTEVRSSGRTVAPLGEVSVVAGSAIPFGGDDEPLGTLPGPDAFPATAEV